MTIILLTVFKIGNMIILSTWTILLDYSSLSGPIIIPRKISISGRKTCKFCPAWINTTSPPCAKNLDQSCGESIPRDLEFWGGWLFERAQKATHLRILNRRARFAHPPIRRTPSDQVPRCKKCRPKHPTVFEMTTNWSHGQKALAIDDRLLKKPATSEFWIVPLVLLALRFV
jgi:hypothetical protein